MKQQKIYGAKLLSIANIEKTNQLWRDRAPIIPENTEDLPEGWKAGTDINTSENQGESSGVYENIPEGGKTEMPKEQHPTSSSSSRLEKGQSDIRMFLNKNKKTGERGSHKRH